MMNFNDKYKENHHNTNNLKDLKNKMSRDKCVISSKNGVLKESRDNYKEKYFKEREEKVSKETELNNLKKQLEAQRGAPIIKSTRGISQGKPYSQHFLDHAMQCIATGASAEV